MKTFGDRRRAQREEKSPHTSRQERRGVLDQWTHMRLPRIRQSFFGDAQGRTRKEPSRINIRCNSSNRLHHHFVSGSRAFIFVRKTLLVLR